MVKKVSSHVAKKEYVKPTVTRNEPLVDITFATVGPGPGPGPGPGVPTTGTATITGTAGSPGTFLGTGAKPGGGDGLDFGGGIDTGFDDGGLTGTVIPGSGGAPGTVL